MHSSSFLGKSTEEKHVGLLKCEQRESTTEKQACSPEEQTVWRRQKRSGELNTGLAAFCRRTFCLLVLYIPSSNNCSGIPCQRMQRLIAHRFELSSNSFRWYLLNALANMANGMLAAVILCSFVWSCRSVRKSRFVQRSTTRQSACQMDFSLFR